jgi:hypothetical protein
MNPHLAQPPDPEQIATTYQHALKRGSLTRIANFLGLKRQVFSKRFLGKGKAKFVFGDAMHAMYATAIIDPAAFADFRSYLDAQFDEWTQPGEREQAEVLLAALMQAMSQIVQLRTHAGTRQEQIVAVSRLKATAARLTTTLSQSPPATSSPLKMARVSVRSSSALDAALKELTRAVRQSGLSPKARKRV